MATYVTVNLIHIALLECLQSVWHATSTLTVNIVLTCR